MNKAAIKKEVLKFNPDAVEIEHRSPPGRTRWTLYTVCFFILSFILWASISKIDRIIPAYGKLITNAATIVVQPLTTSIIKNIDIKVGEVVKKGQILVKLDPTFSKSDVQNLSKKKATITSKIKRLKCELSGTQFSNPGKDLSEEEKIEYKLYLKRKAHYNNRVDAFNSTINQLKAKLDTNKHYYKSKKKQIDIIFEIENMYEKLAKKQYSSKLDFLEIMEQRVKNEAELLKLKKQKFEIFYSIESTQFDKNAFVQEWQEKTTSEFIKTRYQKISIEEELRKAQRLKKLVNLISPKDAVVLEIAKRSVGSVIKEAEPLVTLVPIDVPLEVEAEVNSKDIGSIRVSDSVRIKLEAFPFQKHGTLEGKIRIISSDSFSKKEIANNILYFKTRIALIDKQLKKVPEDFKLLPGMRVTCDINIGQRRIISYFLYPVIRVLDKGLREP